MRRLNFDSKESNMRLKHDRTRFTRTNTMTTPSIILASASARREQLLEKLGVPFKVIPSRVTEVKHEQLTARETAQINAYRKARAVSKKFPDSIVLGADTLVSLEGKVLGKPDSLEEAYLMLEKLSGKTHQVVTAICLLHLRGHRQKNISETSHVTFQTLDAGKIRRYLTRVDPLDKAGSYALQEFGDTIVAKVSGSESNVVGLPVEMLQRELFSFCGLPPVGKASVEATAASVASRQARQMASTIFR
jgi:septum formation protein